jgi:hypothetical protein
MESRRIRTLVIIVVIVAVLYGASIMLKPEAATNSTNSRFNAYVVYFQRQENYIVEYLDFDTFPDMVDFMYKPVGSPNPQAILPNVLVKSIKVTSLGHDFEGGEVDAMMTETPSDNPMTVYYDDEKNTLFFIGDAWSSRFFYAARAPDPDATYGYYATFAAN